MSKSEINTKELNGLIKRAINGDGIALEQIVIEINDLIFNLSLRMLGTISDAQDATQDIIIKIITNLSTFRMESNFKTWVYRISTNFLIDYKKSLFAQYPLDFAYYENDLKLSQDYNNQFEQKEKEELVKELKLSCTNVMLQCLNSNDRCIFILGTMFNVNSKVASQILDISPENYRKKLSRIRKKIQQFLSINCGLTKTGYCKCENRLVYAIEHGRLDSNDLQYTKLEVINKDLLLEFVLEMEKLEATCSLYESLPRYKSPIENTVLIKNLTETKSMTKILNFRNEDYHA